MQAILTRLPFHEDQISTVQEEVSELDLQVDRE